MESHMISNRQQGDSIRCGGPPACFDVALFRMFGTIHYAVGVLFHSPGSRHSRAPWVYRISKFFTPKALYIVLAQVTPQII